MRLTLLVPLIGVFLVFNETLEAVLTWPTFFREDLRLSASSTLPTDNLYYVYFGLCLLGFGSALFSAFCPREISDQPNIGRYVIDAPSANSPVIAKDDFRRVLSLRFPSNLFGESEAEKRLDYPHELEGDFHGLMEELYQAVDFDDGVDYGDSDMPEVMLGSGYLDYTELARRIWNKIRIDWPFTLPFYAAAPQFARDIAFLKFKSLDYTRFGIRVTLALIYVFGFALLLKPTLQVFFLLATAWLR